MLTPDRNILSPPLIQRRRAQPQDANGFIGGGGARNGGLSMARKALLHSPLSMMRGRPSHSASLGTGKNALAKSSRARSIAITKMSPNSSISIEPSKGRENISPDRHTCTDDDDPPSSLQTKGDTTEANATSTCKPDRRQRRRVSWSEELTEVRIVPSRKVVKYQERGATRGLAFRSSFSSSAAAAATARRIKAMPRTSSHWRCYYWGDEDDDATFGTMPTLPRLSTRSPTRSDLVSHFGGTLPSISESRQSVGSSFATNRWRTSSHVDWSAGLWV